MVANRQATGGDRSARYAGAIDCDLHPAVPGMSVLLPYLDEYWREMVSVRALDRLNLSLTSYPQNAPLSCRPDWTLDQGQKAGIVAQGDAGACARPLPAALRNSQLPLWRARSSTARTWPRRSAGRPTTGSATSWLSRDPRLRASIVIPAHNTELAVAEIERQGRRLRGSCRCLMLVSGEVTLGRRQLWPIYRLAEKLRPADRHSRRQRLPLRADAGGMAFPLCRGLHRRNRRLSRTSCRA